MVDAIKRYEEEKKIIKELAKTTKRFGLRHKYYLKLMEVGFKAGYQTTVEAIIERLEQLYTAGDGRPGCSCLACTFLRELKASGE